MYSYALITAPMLVDKGTSNPLLLQLLGGWEGYLTWATFAHRAASTARATARATLGLSELLIKPAPYDTHHCDGYDDDNDVLPHSLYVIV